MLTSALRLDMAFDSTSIAHDLALPIVALPIVALPIVALPIVALPIVALPIVTLSILSPTFLRYKQCSIWSKTAGPAEAGFEGQEVGYNARHCVRFLSELECGCKGSPFFGIRKVGHDVEFPPEVFNRDVAYGKVIDHLVLG